MIVLTPVCRAQHPLLDEALRLVACLAYTDDLGATASICRLSEVFFIEAIGASVEQCPELARILGAMRDAHIGRALELMHDDPSRLWTVEGLANDVGMSRSRFAELLDMGPMACLAEWRL